MSPTAEYGLSIDIFTFDHSFPIVSLIVTIIHISTVNICKIVTDRANIAFVKKYELAHGLSNIVLRFDRGLFSISARPSLKFNRKN